MGRPNKQNRMPARVKTSWRAILSGWEGYGGAGGRRKTCAGTGRSGRLGSATGAATRRSRRLRAHGKCAAGQDSRTAGNGQRPSRKQAPPRRETAPRKSDNARDEDQSPRQRSPKYRGALTGDNGRSGRTDRSTIPPTERLPERSIRERLQRKQQRASALPSGAPPDSRWRGSTDQPGSRVE